MSYIFNVGEAAHALGWTGDIPTRLPHLTGCRTMRKLVNAEPQFANLVNGNSTIKNTFIVFKEMMSKSVWFNN